MSQSKEPLFLYLALEGPYHGRLLALTNGCTYDFSARCPLNNRPVRGRYEASCQSTIRLDKPLKDSASGEPFHKQVELDAQRYGVQEAARKFPGIGTTQWKPMLGAKR